MRLITFDIATRYKNGYYNPTIDWGLIEESLNWLGRYKQVKFRRVSSGGRIHFVQANTQPNPSWMMWTNGWTCNVSPTRNFGRNRFQSAKYWLHEFFHMVRGGTSHEAGNVALMAACSGSCQNITEPDYKYIAAYPWKPGVKLPHLEPNAMAEAFPAQPRMWADYGRLDSHDLVMADHGMTAEVEFTLPRQCQVVRRNWSQKFGLVP